MPHEDVSEEKKINRGIPTIKKEVLELHN